MKIKITQKHIKKAQKAHKNNKLISETCPVAQAVKERIHRFVSVGDRSIQYETSSGNTMRKDLPEKAIKFVDDFDNSLLYGKNPPKPITFSI